MFGSLDLRGAEPFLEVVVVWVTLFSSIEYLTRFQLGRIRWNGGSALDKIVGVSALSDQGRTDRNESDLTRIAERRSLDCSRSDACVAVLLARFPKRRVAR